MLSAASFCGVTLGQVTSGCTKRNFSSFPLYASQDATISNAFVLGCGCLHSMNSTLFGLDGVVPYPLNYLVK